MTYNEERAIVDYVSRWVGAEARDVVTTSEVVGDGMSMLVEEEALAHDDLGEKLESLPHHALDGVLVAIPAFNEERFIGSVVLQVRLLDLPVLVIDDGSSDRTSEIATAAGAVVVRHPVNQGKGVALNTAFEWARRRGSKALVVLDGDGQHPVDEMMMILPPILDGSADIVIGSRFLPTSPGQIPAVRQFGQRAITPAANVFSGASVTDSQSGYRAFSRRAIQLMSFGSKGFSVEVEMQFHAQQHGLVIEEVPITALYHDPPKRNIFGQGAEVLTALLQLVGRHRPLLFFSGTGLVVLLSGLILGGIVTSIYTDTHVLAIGYALLAVLFTIAGLLSVFTGLLLHSVRSTFVDLESRLGRYSESLARNQDDR